MFTDINYPSRNTNFIVAVSALVVLFSSLFMATTGQAADSVGTLKYARGNVIIESASGETRKAAKGDEFMQGEQLVTGAASMAVVQLSDDSRMTLRPNSAFRVNQLNMDSDSDDDSGQNAVLNLLRGGLRLVTGLIGKANPAGYRLNTPIATIGIRGTEFNSRLCASDCAAEEKKLAGSSAAEKIKEGLYVKVDDGGISLKNFSSDDPLEINEGEASYVSDVNSLPVKLSAIPAFQYLDRIPSPSSLDFDDIEIPDDVFPAVELNVEGTDSTGGTENAVAAVAAATAAATSSNKDVEEIDISGTYELEVEYDKDVPSSFRQWFFGADPDIEFELTQEGDKIDGEFEGDFDGTVKGVIDDETVTVEFVLEARGGEYKDGEGTWIVQDNGDLEGKFKIRDKSRGIIRGTWFLTKD